MRDLCIRQVKTDDELRQAFALREAVFVREQHVSFEAEFDGLDQICQHFVASTDGTVLGTLRVRNVEDGLAKIERVAVAKEARGRQIGAELMKVALGSLGESGPWIVKIHAQTHAKAFYEGLGFVAHGDVFEEDGIPHIGMQLGIPSPKVR